MKAVVVEVVNERSDVDLPEYSTDGAACVDLISAERKTLKPFSVEKVRVGLTVAVPKGYVGEIRPRSGLATKKNVIVVPGTIDSDYRGELMVMIYFISNKIGGSYQINRGERIAQFLIRPVSTITWLEVKELSDTNRGKGGFGSTD